MFKNVKITKAFSTDVVERCIEETDEVESVNEDFKVGENFEVDILNDNQENIHVQFGDGSIAFFPKDSIEIDREDEGD
jgi:hypothetical protein